MLALPEIPGTQCLQRPAAAASRSEVQLRAGELERAPERDEANSLGEPVEVGFLVSSGRPNSPQTLIPLDDQALFEKAQNGLQWVSGALWRCD